MAQTLLLKVIKPGLLSPAEVRGRILNVVKKYEKLARQDMTNVVSTWHHGVNIKSKTQFAGGRVSAEVSTDDEIFGYLDKGTSVRYATMTQDFAPKTRQAQLNSGSGSGGVAYISRNQPREGIQARNFSLTIRNKHDANFRADVKKAVREGLKARKRQ